MTEIYALKKKKKKNLCPEFTCENARITTPHKYG